MGSGAAHLAPPPGDPLAAPASMPPRRLDAPDSRPGHTAVGRSRGGQRSPRETPAVAGPSSGHDPGPPAETGLGHGGRLLVARRRAGWGVMRPVAALAAGDTSLPAPTGLVGTSRRPSTLSASEGQEGAGSGRGAHRVCHAHEHATARPPRPCRRARVGNRAGQRLAACVVGCRRAPRLVVTQAPQAARGTQAARQGVGGPAELRWPRGGGHTTSGAVVGPVVSGPR